MTEDGVSEAGVTVGHQRITKRTVDDDSLLRGST